MKREERHSVRVNSLITQTVDSIGLSARINAKTATRRPRLFAAGINGNKRGINADGARGVGPMKSTDLLINELTRIDLDSRLRVVGDVSFWDFETIREAVHRIS